MKKQVFFLKGLAITLLLALTFSACNHDDNPLIDDDIDNPETPEVEVSHSIIELKEIYTEAGNPDLFEITDEVIIEGTVVSSDESGNHYREIYIQDNTGGIQVRLNKNNLYGDYPLGQKIYINAKGMYMGNYGTQIQLGGVFEGSFGRLEEDSIANHITKGESLQMPEAIEIELGENFDDEAYNATWVKVTNVMFTESELGQTYAGDENTNRTLITESGETIIVRTSSYAAFKGETLAEGSGSVSGILTQFNGTLQIILNDLEGVELTGERFNDPNSLLPAEGEGTLASAYNIAAAKENQDTQDKWVKGYIVGFFNNNTLHATTEGALNSNIAIADVAGETNELKVIPVQLPGGFVRENLNIADNPDMLGQMVWLKGDLEAYYGVDGLKSVSAFSLDGETEEEEEVETFQGELVAIAGTDLTNTTIDFRTYNVIASQEFWAAESQKATINAYQKGATEAWMISTSQVDFSSLTDPVLAVTESMNYLTSTDDVQVLGSTDYTGTGDPSSATWTALATKADRVTSGQTKTEFVAEGQMYVAFVYKSSESEAMSWEVITVEATEADTDNGGEEPTDPEKGDLGDPYTVEEVIADNTGSGYVVGYIVGYYTSGSNMNTDGTQESVTNIAIATNANEADISKCIPVQLPKGAVRDALGDHPQSFGSQVWIYGNFEAYFGIPGHKGASKYSLDGETELP
ncbi:DUF5689 domain-containing protein [Sediminitomix flava]|uniref:Uncharacterized protein n=1 Tax=Sediminitomix flava TaxID=379075 RepID=A0A316A0Q3_SEDFL|nr:DUF5689 domain-containing protein [Sediminitomix flava]PWJ43227.1 hypothetical protein BC781_102776 [Sediminitomix flava]